MPKANPPNIAINKEIANGDEIFDIKFNFNYLISIAEQILLQEVLRALLKLDYMLSCICNKFDV